MVTTRAGTTRQEDVKVKPSWQVTEQATTFLNLHTKRKLSVNNCGFIPSAAARELSKTIPTLSPNERGRRAAGSPTKAVMEKKNPHAISVQ